MPLTLLLGSLAGIVLLVLLNRLVSAGRPGASLTVAEAEARLGAEFPDFECGDFLLSDDGRIALFQSSDGAEYAVLVMHGRKLVSRRYPRGDLHLTGRPNGDARSLIQFGTGDFSLPRLRIRIADDRLRVNWRDRFPPTPGKPGQKVKHGSA